MRNVCKLALLSLIEASFFGCTNVSPKLSDFQLSSSVPSLIFSGAPSGGTNVAGVTVNLSGTDIVSYKYKIGPAATTDCNSSSGYSATDITISAAIIESTSTYPDQQINLCAIGKDSKSNSVTGFVSWYYDFSGPVATMSIVEREQSASETDASNKTITFTSSAVKPYPVKVSYALSGDAIYMFDHTLPTTGVITIPAGSSSTVVVFNMIRNMSSSTNSYFQMAINTLDTSASVSALNYQTRFFINDVDGGVRDTITSISSDQGTTCIVLSPSGKLKCWGNNTNGQVGDGTVVNKYSPIWIDPGTSYMNVSTGAGTTCAITIAGTLKCWGNNANGTVGDGTTTQRIAPVSIDGGTTFTQIITANATTCGIISGGALKCWGKNTSGQVGDGTVSLKTIPTLIDSGTSYAEIITANNTTCGITSTNTLKCWGNNTSGQVGDGTTVNKTSPTIITGPAYTIVTIGLFTTCGITTSNLLNCWGLNTNGTVGDGSTTQRTAPVLIDSGIQYIKIVSANESTCGITNTGILKCWGWNNLGQLGDGTTVNKLAPTVIASGTNYSQIAMDSSTTCGITTTNVLNCWGQNNLGQVGDGTIINKLLPTVIDSGTSYNALILNQATTCGQTIANNIKCWGNNASGQLGDNAIAIAHLFPRLISRWLTP